MYKLVPGTGFEPVIFAVRGRCPEPLDEPGPWYLRSAHRFLHGPASLYSHESTNGGIPHECKFTRHKHRSGTFTVSQLLAGRAALPGPLNYRILFTVPI